MTIGELIQRIHSISLDFAVDLAVAAEGTTTLGMTPPQEEIIGD